MLKAVNSPLLSLEEVMDSTLLIKNLNLTQAPDVPFKIMLFEVSPNSQTPVDQHAVQELWFIMTGRGRLMIDQELHEASANNWFYFSSNKTHQLINDGAEPIKVVSIYW